MEERRLRVDARVSLPAIVSEVVLPFETVLETVSAAATESVVVEPNVVVLETVSVEET